MGPPNMILSSRTARPVGSESAITAVKRGCRKLDPAVPFGEALFRYRHFATAYPDRYLRYGKTSA